MGRITEEKDWTFTVTTQGKGLNDKGEEVFKKNSEVYNGFRSVAFADKEDWKKAMYLAFVMEDGEEAGSYLCEDAIGFQELRRYYREVHESHVQLYWKVMFSFTVQHWA
jgi:hypothetical protein